MSGTMEGGSVARPGRLKPYPEYKDPGVEWLGEIPAHWAVKRLKHLAHIASGFAPPESFDRSVGECPVFGSNGLIGYCDQFLVTQETLAVGRVGASGSINIVPARSWVSDNALLLRDLRPSAQLAWLRYVLETMNLATQAAKNAQPIITGTFLGNQALAAPPETEQRVIAAFLDRETAKIDALVAKKERLIELLQEKRTALITRTVTKGLDPNVPMKDSGMEWLGQIPAHWDMTFLDKVVDPLRRITYGIVQPGAPDPEGILMVRGQNYSRGWSNPEEIFRVSPEIEAPYKRARLQGGDIVMTIVGAGTGNVAIVPDWLEGANLTQTTARIAVFQRKGNNRYIAYLLQSVVGKVSVELTVKGAAQPGLNLGHIAKYRVILPPDGEQERIADFLAREVAKLDRLIDKIHESIDGMNEYCTALISAAVTGKIDIRKEVVA